MKDCAIIGCEDGIIIINEWGKFYYFEGIELLNLLITPLKDFDNLEINLKVDKRVNGRIDEEARKALLKSIRSTLRSSENIKPERRLDL